MPYPIEPTIFAANPYDPEWSRTDFFYSVDGIGVYPKHHCKETFLVSLPFADRCRRAVDVGCRDGEYTRYLQDHFTHVYCFDVHNRKYFPYNVDLQKVTHFQCALGRQAGLISMSGGTHRQIEGKMQEHPVFTLDSFAFEEIDYIKVDVEGFERNVLIGAEETIRRCRPLIVIEQNDVRLADERAFAAKHWLEDRGYRHVATCPRGWDHVMQPPASAIGV